MKISKVEVEVPAGKYILGDPCYAVPDSEWMELLESCEFFNSPIGTIRRSPKEGTFNVMETFKKKFDDILTRIVFFVDGPFLAFVLSFQ